MAFKKLTKLRDQAEGKVKSPPKGSKSHLKKVTSDKSTTP
jgi:hypothetical protein